MTNYFNPGPPSEQNQEATLYVGNLDPQVTYVLLWELFLQCGEIVKVYIPKDRVTGAHQGYGFVEFRREAEADYAQKVLNMVKLYGRPLKVNKAARREKKNEFDVGANLFVGNLSEDVDEKILHDTFSVFGNLIQTPVVIRDPESGKSLGYGYIYFDNFISSDTALKKMHGQWLCGKPIRVRYKRKKGSKELHGSEAERLLAANNPDYIPFQMQMNQNNNNNRGGRKTARAPKKFRMNDER